MTTAYAPQAANALATLRRKGAAVTFTHRSGGTYTASTDRHGTASTSTVAGYAIATRGDPVQYAALGLVQREAPTLLFAPSTQGQSPALGSDVSWGGVTYTVRDVSPVSPDATALVCRVVIAR